MTIKIRSSLMGSYHGEARTVVKGVGQSTVHTMCGLNGFQRTETYGHPIRLIKTGLDIGGYFQTGSARQLNGPTMVNIHKPLSSTDWWEYKGPMFAFEQNKVFGAGDLLTPLSDLAMIGYGTTGIARALPTNSLSGMGQFLGELRDLPKIPDIKSWKTMARNFKNDAKHFNYNSSAKKGAGEYLNAQFGWVPFVNDLRAFAKVTRNHSKLAQQFLRNSGRDVRRGSTIFKDSSSTNVLISASSPGVPSINSTGITANGKLYRDRRTTTEIYFKGAFTYYVPGDDSLLGKLQRYEALANHLYGVRLDPHLLWQLAPWSWAVDWVSNAGDIIRNWSAFQNDGLVMRYGYVMANQTRTDTYSLIGLQLYGQDPTTLIQAYEFSSKQRMRATPYGFGLSPGAFSPKQWSIIAALGISRAPRSLNF